jgi:hypothetical protein
MQPGTVLEWLVGVRVAGIMLLGDEGAAPTPPSPPNPPTSPQARIQSVAAMAVRDEEMAEAKRNEPKKGQPGYRWHAMIPQARVCVCVCGGGGT